MLLRDYTNHSVGFPGGVVVKNPPATAGETGKVGSIPGSERSPGVGTTHTGILTWKIPWTERSLVCYSRTSLKRK